MQRRQVLATTAAATAGLAGCTTARERVGDLARGPPERRVDADWRPESGTWAERDYGPANRRHNPHATPPSTEPEVAWERELEKLPTDGWVVVVDDTLFVATEYRLLALDTTDGTVRWERRIDGPAGLKYIDGRLYQVGWGLQEPDLVARSLDGREQWRTTVSDQLRGLHEQDGFVFVAGRSGYWTLHADTGVIVRERDEWVRNLASAGGAVYGAFSEILVRYEVRGRVLAEQWRVKSDTAAMSTRPVVDGETVYVPQYGASNDDGRVLVADQSGDLRRHVNLDHRPRQFIVTEDGPLVVQSGDRGTRLYAIQPDGEHRWKADVAGRTEAVTADGTVYAGDPLAALDSESGERRWERDVGGAVPLAAADATLYVATHDRLAALRE